MTPTYTITGRIPARPPWWPAGAQPSLYGHAGSRNEAQQMMDYAMAAGWLDVTCELPPGEEITAPADALSARAQGEAQNGGACSTAPE